MRRERRRSDDVKTTKRTLFTRSGAVRDSVKALVRSSLSVRRLICIWKCQAHKNFGSTVQNDSNVSLIGD